MHEQASSRDEHGFRHWYPEYGKNEFSQDVCEHALAHGLLDKVDAAYWRGDLLDKRRYWLPHWQCGD